ITDGDKYIFTAQLVGFYMSIVFNVMTIALLILMTILLKYVFDPQRHHFVLGIMFVSTSAILAAIIICTGISGGIENTNSTLVDLEKRNAVETSQQCCFEEEGCVCKSSDGVLCKPCQFKGVVCFYTAIGVDCITFIVLLTGCIVSFLHKKIEEKIDQCDGTKTSGTYDLLAD
ncbi:hypothetical protein EIN_379930, partial [Entamoeba invadens IP1]